MAETLEELLEEVNKLKNELSEVIRTYNEGLANLTDVIRCCDSIIREYKKDVEIFESKIKELHNDSLMPPNKREQKIKFYYDSIEAYNKKIETVIKGKTQILRVKTEYVQQRDDSKKYFNDVDAFSLNLKKTIRLLVGDVF